MSKFCNPQAPVSVEFSRQEYWSGLPFPSAWDLPHSGIKPISLVSESHSVVSNSLRLCGLYSPGNSPGQNSGVDSLSLLQGIFPTRGSNPGLPNCRQILYQLSHKGNPRILEWVAYLPDWGIDLGSPALHTDSYQLSYQGSPHLLFLQYCRS